MIFSPAIHEFSLSYRHVLVPYFFGVSSLLFSPHVLISFQTHGIIVEKHNLDYQPILNPSLLPINHRLCLI